MPPPVSRLFFALWPTPQLAGQLHTVAVQSAASHGGRIMRVDTLHLTMAFLGDTPSSDVPALADIGADCARAVRPFDLTLDHLGYWPRKHIIWLGPEAVPQALTQLADALADRLGDALHDRRFNPHITLVRKAGGCAGGALLPLCWRVDALCLVRSITTQTGAQYATIARWPLGECDAE